MTRKTNIISTEITKDTRTNCLNCAYQKCANKTSLHQLDFIKGLRKKFLSSPGLFVSLGDHSTMFHSNWNSQNNYVCLFLVFI
jgi:hypothetical protein